MIATVGTSVRRSITVQAHREGLAGCFGRVSEERRGNSHARRIAASPAALLILLVCALAGGFGPPLLSAENAPTVVEIDLDRMINHVTGSYVTRGILYANEIHAHDPRDWAGREPSPWLASDR